MLMETFINISTWNTVAISDFNFKRLKMDVQTRTETLEIQKLIFRIESVQN